MAYWAMRCEEHGLAAGPGGECVVCMREARSRASLRARRLGAAFCSVVVLACAGLFAARLLRTTLIAEPPLRVATHAAEPSMSVPALPPQALPPQALPPQALPPQALPPQELPPQALPPANTLPADALPRDAPSAGEPVAAISATSPLASAPPTANQRVPSQRELTFALQATPVSMFSASWCPHCRRARRFFQAYGVRVVDRDIDLDAEAAAELRRRSGGTAVPLIDVDGIELRGFDERATMAAVIASVERRLGVNGVRLSVASVSN
jgi:glutaredoxin 3